MPYLVYLPNFATEPPLGRLEMDFACEAEKARLPIVICNPMQVRQFAKSTGRVAKTDRLEGYSAFRRGLKATIKS